MDKTLYNTAMDKVTMSDECIGSILDSIEDVQTEKKPKKIRYIHIIVALAVFLFGSVGVAAETVGFDWIKGFFYNIDSENEVVIDEFVTDLITELEDFKCESDYGIKFSPIGCISEYRNLYASLNIDELPDDVDLKNDGYYFVPDFSDRLDSFTFGTNWCDIKNHAATVSMSCSEDFFKNGETIELYLKRNDEAAGIDTIYATVSFKISNNKKYHTLKIDYNNYKSDGAYSNIFSEITVSPLSLTTHGRAESWMDENGHYCSGGIFKFVFNDGNEIEYSVSGSHDDISGMYCCEVNFMDGPINPDNITEIYYNDTLIYSR